MHGHNWQRNQEYHHQAKANRAARANTEPQQTSGAHYTNTAMTVAMQPRWPNAPAAFIIPTPEFIEGSSMNQEEYHEDGYEINDHLSDDHENYFDLQEDDQDQYVGCSLDDNLANSHSVDACKTFPFCTNVSRCNYNINPIIPICIPERVNPISYYNTALSTYTMGNQHQYYTCAGRTNNCPCPSCTAKRNGDTLWMCDSGASEHFTFELSDYLSYEPFSSARTAKTADGTSQLLGQGTVIMNHKLSDGSSHLVKLYPVLYMPKLNIRLISNGMLCKQGLLATQDDLRIIFSYRDGAKQCTWKDIPLNQERR